MAQGIPDAARALISEHIESVAQLDVLLLLRTAPGRLWDAADVGKELRTSAELAEAVLARLSRGGLVAVEIDPQGHPCFRFAPASSRLRASVDQLAGAYATHKTAVIALIFSGPTDSIQGFADAFRMRGEET